MLEVAIAWSTVHLEEVRYDGIDVTEEQSLPTAEI
jgi:hypothetical protein